MSDPLLCTSCHSPRLEHHTIVRTDYKGMDLAHECLFIYLFLFLLIYLFLCGTFLVNLTLMFKIYFRLHNFSDHFY